MGAYDEVTGEVFYPSDLAKNNQSTSDQNYFTVVVPNLKVQTQYSFQFQWVLPDGTRSKWSNGYTLTTAGYATKLTKPTISVTAASLGYTVSYTKQTDSNFAYAIVEEVVSSSETAPTSGWTEVAVTSSNPITITIGSVSKRWVRVKLTDKIAGSTAYSDPVAVTPVDPVAAALDITPPTSASGISAVWSGNNILITATVSADSKKFIIRLTNGSSVGFFTKFPTASGTSQTILITEQELYNTFGQYFVSFDGLLISADSLDNRDSGVAFTVSEQVNELNGVVPTFSLTAISNGYTVTYTLPTGASYAKVYASSTSGFTPDDNTNLVYSGASPGLVVDSTYTVKYVKIKFFKINGSTSSISLEQSVTPADPGMLSLIDNEVKISTTGSILAGDSATSGGRGIFNKTGIYFYDTGGNATSQLMANASSGSPTFITTSAKIADWIVSSNKIENTLHAGTTQYSGLSPSGTYAFWAGSTVSGGNSAANFSVTPAGAVIAKNITITGGSLTVGASSIAASTGKLISTDAEITGKITANSGKIGNINIDSGGLYITDNTVTAGNRVIFDSGGIAAYKTGVTDPTFELANDGTGKIGGWNINATSLSSSGMVLDSSEQTIAFTSGFIMDNDSISVPVISSTSVSGSSSTESDTPESEQSSISSGTSSSTSSTFAIKLPTANFTNNPKITLTSDSTSGASVLISNYGNSSYSSIQLANGGIDLYVGRSGAVTLRGFTSKYHYSYNYSVVPAMLMVKPDGTMSTGRSIFKSGASETSIITNGSHNHVGLIGDLMFSTAD